MVFRDNPIYFATFENESESFSYQQGCCQLVLLVFLGTGWLRNVEFWMSIGWTRTGPFPG